MKFKMDIIRMRLIILKFLYFVVVMWQVMWTTCMSRIPLMSFSYIVIYD
jgi:hypothetical protein